MKRVFRIVVSLLLCLLIGYSAEAQETVKKKVAVYVTGDAGENVKRIIGNELVNVITRSNGYTAVERTDDFLKALAQENDYQMSGEVRDSQIAALGQKFGVKYVIVADVSEEDDGLYIASRLINVVTGEVDRSTSETGEAETTRQKMSLAQKVADSLLSSLGGRTSTDGTQQKGNIETFTVNGVSFQMVRVEGGSFEMGSNSYIQESPAHTEVVGTFYIGQTEVTQALWMAVMGYNCSEFLGENRPVEKVSWNECQTFVEKLSRLTGRVFRLPTEAEWEYAARGGNQSRGYSYSGSDDIDRVAWYVENSGRCTHPVGQKLGNELGLYDMIGNVSEWTSNNYSDGYGTRPRSSFEKVVRGGSYDYLQIFCRITYRFPVLEAAHEDFVGLRLAL